ncbi:RNA polymerase sigma factor SigJ [Streptomyces mayteni]
MGEDLATQDAALRDFETHRTLLFGVAYRMLGGISDAEDTVQEAWLRWSAADRSGVAEPRAYLVRIVSRLAVDRLRQLAARRESYVGPWLPEPLPADRATADLSAAPDGAERAVLADTVSYAVLIVLESLSPLERAVFVLREAFALPFAEIATALGRAEPAVRQLAGRARRHVAEGRPRYEVDAGERRDLTERFLAAALEGDIEGLLSFLAPDVALTSDTGGKARGPRRVITGSEKVGRFLAGVGGRAPAQPGFRIVEFNGMSGLLVTAAGRPFGVFLLEAEEGAIRRIFLIGNPDKLGHLLPD